MKKFLFAVFLLVGLTAHGQRFVKTFNTVAEMLAANPNDVHTQANLLGYYAPNDGGGGPVYYDKSSSITERSGVYWKPTSYNGRWIRVIENGTITAKKFGAKGDGVTDDTAAIQSAIDYAESRSIVPTINFEEGDYIASGLIVHKVSLRGISQAGMYNRIFSFKGGARLTHKIGATSDLITIFPEHMTAIEISDLDLLGNKESNLKNPATITAVSSRLAFTVTTAQLPTAPASPSTYPYYGECFFYTQNGQYLGAGLVESINYGTGAITLKQYSDHYATDATASQLLSTGYKVCFSSSITGNHVVVAAEYNDPPVIPSVLNN